MYKKTKQQSKDYLTMLQKVIPEYQVVEWTDFEDNCYTYRILIKKDQALLDDDRELLQSIGNERIDLHLFISAIDNIYYMDFEKTAYKPETDEFKFYRPKHLNTECIQVNKKLHYFLDKKGFKAMPRDLLVKKLPGVSTNFKDKGEATLFDCLFTDYYRIP